MTKKIKIGKRTKEVGDGFKFVTVSDKGVVTVFTDKPRQRTRKNGSIYYGIRNGIFSDVTVTEYSGPSFILELNEGKVTDLTNNLRMVEESLPEVASEKACTKKVQPLSEQAKTVLYQVILNTTIPDNAGINMISSAALDNLIYLLNKVDNA